MILQSIEKRRNKIILSFDESEKLEIYYDVYLTFSLLKGGEITSQKIDEIKLTNAEFEVKNSAFRFLSNRNHSAFELETKLKKKGFDPEIIQKVIIDLKDKMYLNDFTFAENFVRNRVERRKEGIIKITSELYKKGIAREIIAEVTEAINENPKNYENAFELGKSKYEIIIKRGETDKNKIKSKLFNFMRGRGFTSDIIVEVIKELIDE
ncbi:MAG: recombination regulator RecX [Melioribacteraceae bacterium]|nr:recombination regulator RecX [Melioribacteraceae bacterium]